MGGQLNRLPRLSWLAFPYGVNGLLTFLPLALLLPVLTLPSLLYTAAYVATVQALLYLVLYLPLLALLPRRGALVIRILETLRLALIAIDFCVFHATGLHLYDGFVTQQLFEPRFWQDIGLSAQMVLELLSLLLVAALTQWALPRLQRVLEARLAMRPASSRRAPLMVALIGVAAALHLFAPGAQREQLSRYLPVYEWLQPAHLWSAYWLKNVHLLSRKQALRYPLHPLGALDPTQLSRPNILLIAAESLRGDMLNPQDMPELWRYGEAHQALISQHHFSGGHQTWEGMFSLVYALNGYHRAMFADQHKPPYTLQMLRQLGYRTVALCGSPIEFTHHQVHIGFDHIVDLSGQDGDKADQGITKHAMQLLADQRALPENQRRPLFILLFYNSTHYPYFFPSDEAQFQPYRPWPASNLLRPIGKDRLRTWNRYRNATRHFSKQAGRLLDAAEPEWRQGRLAVVITGDHGEEFWDEGQFGHGSLRLNNARFETPLLLALPGLTLRSVPVSSHVDLFPTLFDWMKVPLSPTAYSDGTSLLGPRQPPLAHLNIYNFPQEPSFALIAPPYKIFARRDDELGFEINQVLDVNDRPISWNLPYAQSQLGQWLNRIDRFYPGHVLPRTRTIAHRPLPHYPFEPRRGPIRTAQTPDVLPWQP